MKCALDGANENADLISFSSPRLAPSETTGFIGVQAIRLKKYGAMKADAGEEL